MLYTLHQNWSECWGTKLISDLVPTLVEEYGTKDFYFPNTSNKAIIKMCEAAQEMLDSKGIVWEVRRRAVTS